MKRLAVLFLLLLSGFRFPVSAISAPAPVFEIKVNANGDVISSTLPSNHTVNFPPGTTLKINGVTSTGDKVVPATVTATPSQFLTGYNATTGAHTRAQPFFTDISGVATSAQIPPAILAKGLFAEYRMDEGSGYKLYNSARTNVRTTNLFNTEGNDFGAGWSGTSGTITTRYAVDPFGGFNASRYTTSTAGHKVYQTLPYISGTTHTLSVYVKSNTGVAQSMRMFYNAAAQSDIAIPATGWIRVSATFADFTNATHFYSPFGIDTAGDPIDILVFAPMLEIGPSASDYIPAASGVLAYDAPTTPPSWQTYGVDLGAGGVNARYFHGEVPRMNAAQVTLYIVARWPVANNVANQIGLFGGVYGNGGSTSDFRIEANPNGTGYPNFKYGTVNAEQGVGAIENWHDGAWHLLTGTYNGTTIRLYIDDCLISSQTAAAQSPRVTSYMQLGALNDAYCFGGHIAYASAYNVAHSQAQQLQQFSAISALMAQRGVTLASLQKVVVFEGDSITSGNGTATPYPTVIASNLATGSVFPEMANRSVASARIINNSGNDLTTRWADESLIFSVARTNGVYCAQIGHNDLGLNSAATVYAQLKTFYQALRAAGVTKRILVSVPPSTGIGVGGASMNTLRNALNALTRADTSGDWNYYADLDTNATIGADSAASNATYYPDGVHPSTAAHALIAPIVQTQVAAALQ